MQRHKLIIVYPNQFGYHTDSYKYCEYLPPAYDITYICFDQGFDRLQLPGIDVIYVPYNIGKIKRLLLYFKTVFKVCHSHPDNTLFTIQFKFSFLVGLFASSKLKILDFRTGDLSKSNLRRWLNNRLLWFDSLFFHKTSVISSGLQKILGLNSKKTLVLPLGADVITEIKHTYETLDLLYVGSLHRRNIHETVEGLSLYIKQFQESKPKIKYTIIGFGSNDDIKLLENSIKNNQLENTVNYVGRKKHTELSEYFSKCNIGVSYLPITLYYDHQPVTKTFEYVLSGLFTIATDTYENRQAINKSNGVLCMDTPQSFAAALQKTHEMTDIINEEEIRNSIKDCHWKHIVEDKLKPFLE